MALYVLVEGNDDERFFERIFSPKLRDKYGRVRFYKYRCEKSQKILNLIHSIQSMGEQYVLTCDINDFPCVTAKKQGIARDWSGEIAEDKVVVVVKEIEAWYLAGASAQLLGRLGSAVTDETTKEQFATLVPNGMPRIQFMQQILSGFDLTAARKRNRSLQHFARKWTD